MRAKGSATVMAGSLSGSIPDADWHFSIRRVDGKTHGLFFDFHKKEASAADVAKYLPNWEALQWTEINDSTLGKSEFCAKDLESKVDVQLAENGSKTHKEVVEAFLTFLRSA
jgi:hypothetical protein